MIGYLLIDLLFVAGVAFLLYFLLGPARVARALRGGWQWLMHGRQDPMTVFNRVVTGLQATIQSVKEVLRQAETTQADIQRNKKRSEDAVASLGKPYKWLHSYVAGDKVYCVHQAEDASVIEEHARVGGFPANLVAEVASVFDSTGPRARVTARVVGRGAGREYVGWNRASHAVLEASILASRVRHLPAERAPRPAGVPTQTDPSAVSAMEVMVSEGSPSRVV